MRADIASGLGEKMAETETSGSFLRGWHAALMTLSLLLFCFAPATAGEMRAGPDPSGLDTPVRVADARFHPGSGGHSAVIASVGAELSRPLAPASRDGILFDASLLPGRLRETGLRSLWARGIELERREDFLASAREYEKIVLRVPEEDYAYWRISRNYWRYAESLPTESTEQRLVYFQQAADWADRGMEVNSDCGACMLWKFVSLGRQATTRGLLSAVADAREMNRLLSRGIELQPPHRDNAGNSTLGNLYYAASVFYRIVPDWWWLRVLVGVRGDKAKSVRYARRAVESSPVRVDYRIELGASLLCLGAVESAPESVREGEQVLSAALELPDYLSTDAVDREHAQVLLGAPQRGLRQRPSPIYLSLLARESERRPRGPGMFVVLGLPRGT